MSREVREIADRLSLRAPQRRSLELLDEVCRDIGPAKDTDLGAALATMREKHPTVTSFEREFVSLCFALATGVGKTRLMGAFIAYLVRTGRSRNFFIVAPNLTLYEKLIRDFTHGSGKYVLGGLVEFATSPPIVITGDNYEAGRGVRNDYRHDLLLPAMAFDEAVHINVFNISKINSDVRASQKGGRLPRIKRAADYLGASYYDYLSGLPDLVLLMDESHWYRADAGTRSLNELRPILGLELTATPFLERGGKTQWFQNIAFKYDLAEAIRDGFVKEPAVATRKDFDASKLDETQLERMKLEDGIRLHEQVRVDLDLYADRTKRPRVKPFVLVIARDVEHATNLRALMESDGFFGGQYRGRVIDVHSGTKSGAEDEETTRRLLAVEDAGEPTEIVIHVNMLKEGWDVRNLFTIIPLRAAKARTLIEQSIGRGLRLPYGERTGDPKVDRLTIVAHDRFQEIVDEANREDSIIRGITTIELDPEGPGPAPTLTTVLPGFATGAFSDTTVAGDTSPPTPPTPEQIAVATTTLDVIGDFERLSSSGSLASPEILPQIVREVTRRLPAQAELSLGLAAKVTEDVERVVAQFIANTIDVPAIALVPKDGVRTAYDPFELDLSSVRLQPVAEEILVHELRTNRSMALLSNGGGIEEPRLENYVVRALIEYPTINYDAHADLLYAIAAAVVAHLRSYLASDDAVRNVLQYHQRIIGEVVLLQLEAHRRNLATEYEVSISRGFRTLRALRVLRRPGQQTVNVFTPSATNVVLRETVFVGFRKCVFPEQTFDVNPERLFAIAVDADGDVLRWFRPEVGQIPITYGRSQNYNPDFVVESTGARWLIEIKARKDVNVEEVREKARAAREWCRHATAHVQTHGDGKPWRYLLIAHDEVETSRSLAWFAKVAEGRD